MRAILLKEGRILDLFTLKSGGENEVVSFLQSSGNQELRKCIARFTRLFEIIADERGLDLPRGMKGAWREHGELLIELKKGAYRIGCFQYGRKLLLVNVFRKTRDVETGAYEHAVDMKKAFDENQIWSK